METITQPLAFDELSNYAKQQAIGEYGQPPDDWYEEIYARAKEEGPARGFIIDEIKFSGFHSQGDGASWTGFVYLQEFIQYHNTPDAKDYTQYSILAELIRDGWCEGSVAIRRSGFYYNHSGTMRSEGIDDRIHYAEDDSVLEGGILDGANVRELAKSIDTDALLNELGEWVTDKARAYADDIFKQLREEYDAYTEEQYFKELCDINGWRFDQRGILIEE
jgi:hypothetical protein